MTALLANNATSTLASAITDTDTTVVLATGDGASFPSPTGDGWFPLTLQNSSSLEIVRITARSGDSLQVVRAQEGTTAQAFSVGDSAELRFTEAVHSSYGQAADIALAVSDHAATNDHPLATTIAKGFLSAADKTKLDTVESGATADQTKADIDALKIDADTLDGIDSLGFDLAGDADTAVSDHVAETDPHTQYAGLDGGASANFASMPQVGGDPIVESGSNSNGQYTKFSDGTLICVSNGEKTFTFNSADELLHEWTYPTAFSTYLPSLSWAAASRDSLVGAPDIVQEINVSGSTTSRGLLRFWSSGGTGPFSPGDFCTGVLTAIGRWF